jgi:pyrimidine operon attenuation protein/uracil phosphoribosyltransferase
MAKKKRKPEKIMNSKEISKTIERIAHEIIERNDGLENVVLVGILTNGYPIALELSDIMEKVEEVKVPVGKLDIALYRDDLVEMAGKVTIKESDVPFDIHDKYVVLVDDVLFHGRTIRAALDGLIDYGRPKEIQLAVLVDRGHRELPIQADYIGKTIKTKREENIKVEFSIDNKAVYIL